MKIPKSKVFCISGHYGSGKTNFALNLARYLKTAGKNVTLADLDIVNPYFRTADFKSDESWRDIDILAPIYASSNLDIPALGSELARAVNAAVSEENGAAVIDIGGDDSGAIVLARYKDELARAGACHIYAANFHRYLTKTAEESFAYLREIESVMDCKYNFLVNCSNLSYETTAEDILRTIPLMDELSRMADTETLCTAVKSDLIARLSGKCENLFPVEIYVGQV